VLALYHLSTCNNYTTSVKTPLHGQASTPLCVRTAQKSCDRTALFQKGESSAHMVSIRKPNLVLTAVAPSVQPKLNSVFPLFG